MFANIKNVWDTINAVPFAKHLTIWLILVISVIVEFYTIKTYYLLLIPIVYSIGVALICFYYMFDNKDENENENENLSESAFTYAMHICVGLSVYYRMKMNYLHYTIAVGYTVYLLIIENNANNNFLVFVNVAFFCFEIMLFVCNKMLNKFNMQYKFEEIVE